MADVPGVKVLLVDDVEFIVDVMRGYLKRTPVETISASNGKEALDQALLHWPDLIIMDVSMPTMGGEEACRTIKSHPKLQKTPVLLTYDPNRDPSSDELMKCGCDGVIEKPLARENFLTITHQRLFHLDRLERRAPCQMTVEFSIGGETRQGLGVDISRNGLYIEFREPIKEKANVDVTFLLATICNKPVSAKGRIIWINQGHPRPNLGVVQGFGIEFRIISEESRAIINRYLEEN
ncbi:MAG: response regulator [Desulfuromonadales bacterium]|nr:response regulator [Desulfuromonadales bacterium]